MSTLRTAAALLLGSLLLSACGAAASTDGQIGVTDARIPVPAGSTGAVYLTLTNDADTDDALTGASTDVAGTVELHETSTADGTMSMQQLQQIDIPAGGDAVLEPGGLHIMLIDVSSDLAEGDEVDVTLEFENAGSQSVTATVVPLGEGGGMEMGSEDAMEMGSEDHEAMEMETGS